MAVLPAPRQGTVDALKNFDHGGEIPERPETPGGARGAPKFASGLPLGQRGPQAPLPVAGPLVATSPPGPQASGMELEITRRMRAPARRCA
jgi:hypothetical protein